MIHGVTFFHLGGKFAPSNERKGDVEGQRFTRDDLRIANERITALDQRHLVGMVRFCRQMSLHHGIVAIYTVGVSGDSARKDCHGHGLSLDFSGFSKALPSPLPKGLAIVKNAIRLGTDFIVFYLAERARACVEPAQLGSGVALPGRVRRRGRRRGVCSPCGARGHAACERATRGDRARGRGRAGTCRPVVPPRRGDHAGLAASAAPVVPLVAGRAAGGDPRADGARASTRRTTTRARRGGGPRPARAARHDGGVLDADGRRSAAERHALRGGEGARDVEAAGRPALGLGARERRLRWLDLDHRAPPPAVAGAITRYLRPRPRSHATSVRAGC